MLAAGSAYAASLNATDAGWHPLVSLFGGGDKARAVEQIGAVNNAFSVSIRNTQRDKDVQQFIDATMEDFSDFDLADFYKRLPNVNGDFRELWVRGEIKGNAFIVSQAKDKKNYAVTLKGDRNELGALSLTVRAKPVKGVGDKSAYAVGVRTGMGIGAVQWANVMTSVQDFARIATTLNPDAGASEPIAAAAETRAKVKQLHPKLNSEDLDVLALFWEAYPSVSAAISNLSAVDDVRTVWKGKDYQQLSVSMHGTPDRLEKGSPKLADYFSNMGDVASFDIKWLDREGRTLTQMKLDTEKLTFQFTCFVKDGALLPFKGVKVYEDAPVAPMASSLTATRVVVDARIKLLGVIIKLQQLNLDLFYLPNPRYAEMGLSFTKLPQIKVEGAALGVVPTSMVDAFIPGDIEGLARDFLSVAAKGNGGKGFVLAGKLGEGKEDSDRGVLEVGADIDMLDNFLIKIGVGMVNDRLVPKPAALEEAKALSASIQTAFSKDFTRFAKQTN